MYAKFPSFCIAKPHTCRASIHCETTKQHFGRPNRTNVQHLTCGRTFQTNRGITTKEDETKTSFRFNTPNPISLSFLTNETNRTTSSFKEAILQGFQFLKTIKQHDHKPATSSTSADPSTSTPNAYKNKPLEQEGERVEGWMDPRLLEAQLLLAAVVKQERDFVVSHPNAPLKPEQMDQFKSFLIRRVVEKEPVCYITGKKEFWSLEFTVTKDTLIPRPSTETLVDAALGIFSRDQPLKILDLGTGSGCLLLSLLSEYTQAEGIGVDASDKALDVAQRNANQLGFQNRANFKKGNWVDEIQGEFDLIVSNPPYVSQDEYKVLDESITLWEPKEALVGGVEGLDCYRAIAQGIASKPHILKNPSSGLSGVLILEIGMGQSPKVQEIFKDLCKPLEHRSSHQDLAGIERCLVFQKRDTREGKTTSF